LECFRRQRKRPRPAGFTSEHGPLAFALVEAADARTLQDFILNRAQGIAGVTKSDSHLVFEK